MGAPRTSVVLVKWVNTVICGTRRIVVVKKGPYNATQRVARSVDDENVRVNLFTILCGARIQVNLKHFKIKIVDT